MTVISPGIATGTIDYLFSSTSANSQANLDGLANTALGQGIDLYQNGDYNRAISAFRRCAALSPFSDNAAKAYDYMGKTCLKLEKTGEAIKTYQEAIRIYPTSAEFQRALGDIYLKENRQDDALNAYKAAVRLDPSDAESRYSLGQSYLTDGQLSAAREQFAVCARISPASSAGYYGLGQTARWEGDYLEAVLQLDKAIQMDDDFEKAYVELGYAYADMGDFQKATEQADILSAKGSKLAASVESYISNAKQPQITAARSNNGFNTILGRGTKLSALSANLEAAGNSNIFSMSFTFSKAMNEESIMNHSNWTISRASIQENGGIYNGGFTLPSTEAFILPNPVSVSYNTTTNTATVQFRLSQNALANATIDPAHIVFKFHGLDTYGKAMDQSADEYSGFSRIA